MEGEDPFQKQKYCGYWMYTGYFTSFAVVGVVSDVGGVSGCRVDLKKIFLSRMYKSWLPDGPVTRESCSKSTYCVSVILSTFNRLLVPSSFLPFMF